MILKAIFRSTIIAIGLSTGQAYACTHIDPFRHTRAALPSFNVLAIGSSSTGGVGAGSKTSAYPQQIAPALRDSRLRPTVVARGIGGEKAKGALARLPKAIAEVNPALVIWQVGTNDANARLDPENVADTIRKGVAIIRAAGADAMLVDPQFYPRIANKPHYAEMAGMIDAVGVELCVPVVDRFEEMRDSGPKVLPGLLARDKFHMSALGHRLLAERISHEIMCGLGRKCLDSLKNRPLWD